MTTSLGLRACALLLAVAALAAPVAAQSVATRSPNLSGGWTAAPGVIQFNFLHRFSVTDAPLRKVINTPTFIVGTGLTGRIMAGFVYGSNSTLVPAYPNEWEFYARALPWDESRGGPVDVSVQAGWNVASESVDGELLVARTFGRLRVLAAGRTFSGGYEGEDARYALAGGAALRLTNTVSLAGDYGALLDRSDEERAAWGAGLQLGVPYTPHSVSIHVTNVGTASLEGASRGTRTRWGFEYTVPITVRRLLPARGGRARMPAQTARPMTATSDTVLIEIRNLSYATTEVRVARGTTVVWVNEDPVQHSVTADDERFDSDLIDPGSRFVLSFDEPGTYRYHCIPHPFMMGRVIVTDGEARTGGQNR